MYRFLIEHPRWVPPADLAKIDVRAGSGLGRIYRVRPADKPLRPWVRLDKLDTAGLVAALDSPNGWQRDTAMMMLVWKNDPAARELLEKLFRTSPRGLARLHALCALDGIGQLKKESIEAAFKDADPAVRQHAIRLAEPHLAADIRFAVNLLFLRGDTDSHVRLQLAYSLGKWPDWFAVGPLKYLIQKHPDDAHLITAVMSSLNKDNLSEFSASVLGTAEEDGPPPQQVVRDLIASAAGIDNGSSLPSVLFFATFPALKRDGFHAWQLTAVASALDSLERQGMKRAKLPPDTQEAIATVVVFARKLAAKEGAPEADTLAAMPLLGRDPAARADDVKRLAGLLAPARPAAVQTAAVAALARTRDESVPPALVSAWSGASPGLRARILDALLARPAWHPHLLEAVEKGTIPVGQIDAARRERLTAHPDSAVRGRAAKLFAGGASGDRQKVIDDYTAALALTGDRARGKAMFAKSCSACHVLDGVGSAVGPDLAALANKTPLYLLTEILDPSRNLDSRYAAYQATLNDERTFTGVLAAESGTAITLRDQNGKDAVILRSDIDSLRGTAKSLMPEGLEKDIGKQEMADLIAYLTAADPPKSDKPLSPAELAKLILDDATPKDRREALVSEAVPRAVDVLRAMTADLPPDDPKEEYRRIPWVWRVSIAAGRGNDPAVLRGLLETSLPKPGEPLRDWQAVVLGGGVINGLSLENIWPGRRLAELMTGHPELAKRWAEALKLAHVMADAEKVPTGTRYDALRMVALDGWDAAVPRLVKYLAKSAHAELQMGAVSGLVDVEKPEVTDLLVKALPDLTAGNRKLAVAGLLRTPERSNALLDALEKGSARPEWVEKEHREKLLKHPDEAVRKRAAKVLGGE
jgi:putative heme-binding domain-containing protein